MFYKPAQEAPAGQNPIQEALQCQNPSQEAQEGPRKPECNPGGPWRPRRSPGSKNDPGGQPRMPQEPQEVPRRQEGLRTPQNYNFARVFIVSAPQTATGVAVAKLFNHFCGCFRHPKKQLVNLARVFDTWNKTTLIFVMFLTPATARPRQGSLPQRVDERNARNLDGFMPQPGACVLWNPVSPFAMCFAHRTALASERRSIKTHKMLWFLMFGPTNP